MRLYTLGGYASGVYTPRGYTLRVYTLRGYTFGLYNLRAGLWASRISGNRIWIGKHTHTHLSLRKVIENPST